MTATIAGYASAGWLWPGYLTAESGLAQGAIEVEGGAYIWYVSTETRSDAGISPITRALPVLFETNELL